MADYKKMYITLFRNVSKAIELLQAAQLTTEEIFISSDQPGILLLTSEKGGISMSLGEKLKSLRIREKKTLKEQSEVFGVSLNTVYRWEHNLAVPRKSALIKMAVHYNVSIGWLLDESVDTDDP